MAPAKPGAAADPALVGAIADADAELRRLNWALAAYARSSTALIHSETLHQTVDGICRAIVANEVYALAWVGLVGRTPDKPVNILSGAGRAIGYLNGLEISWSDAAVGGQGPAGRAVREGVSYIMREAWVDPLYAPWRDLAARYGIRSSVTVPFGDANGVLGVLSICADRPDAFGPEELSLFEKLGDELAFSMTVHENRAKLEISEAARQAAEATARDTQAELSRVARVLTVSEFASSLAHEINQPIAAILANSYASLRWLADERLDVNEARAAITRTIRDATRASEVVERTRAWIAKEGQASVKIDLNLLLMETLSHTQAEQRRAQVTVRTQLCALPPVVVGDRIQLQQVTLNLILNALDAMRANTTQPRVLEAASAVTDDQAQISIQDTGPGVDPAHMDRLFEHFFTTKVGGIGLGLAISRSIVESHGGTLSVSPAPSGGARFVFSLPMAPSAEP